jgi:uncharacterized protein
VSTSQSPFRILGHRPADPLPQAVPAPDWKPASSDFHFIHASSGVFLFAVDGSRLYELAPADASKARALSSTLDANDFARHVGLEAPGRRWIDGTTPDLPRVRSISLQVAQSCNLSCPYCYADEGRFGGRPKMMGHDVAKCAIDRLIAESEPGACLVLGYMGGEPLLNWPVIRDLTPYAAERANSLDRRLRFSITTNGTLLRQEQAQLFADYEFTVQLSMDGLGDNHDSLRRSKDGSSSYQRALEALEVIRRIGRPRSLTARATVTPQSADLLETLDGLIEMGFDDVGFAAALTSPSADHRMNESDLRALLTAMTACGDKTLSEARKGRRYPFGNLLTAIEQIHRGSHQPYPCGAGAAYLSADSEGSLYACHRLIDDQRFYMGTVLDGVDQHSRVAHLTRSHVDRQEPCQSCWARYLCGGGCYHEVVNRGRIACEYIRGWLEYCIGAYADLDAPTLDLLLGRSAHPNAEMSAPFGGLLR